MQKPCKTQSTIDDDSKNQTKTHLTIGDDCKNQATRSAQAGPESQEAGRRRVRARRHVRRGTCLAARAGAHACGAALISPSPPTPARAGTPQGARSQPPATCAYPPCCHVEAARRQQGDGTTTRLTWDPRRFPGEIVCAARQDAREGSLVRACAMPGTAAEGTGVERVQRAAATWLWAWSWEHALPRLLRELHCTVICRGPAT